LEADPKSLFLLTMTFAIIGVGLGALFGYALKHFLPGNRMTGVHGFLLFVSGGLAVGYVWAVYLIRTHIPQVSALLPGPIAAAGLVILSGGGMILSTFAGCFCEAFYLCKDRWLIQLTRWRLSRTLEAVRYCERQLARHRSYESGEGHSPALQPP